MTISSQTPCLEACRKCGVGFIHTQLASSHANVPQKLASSPSTVGFITRYFHALISRQHSQTNQRSLYTLFLASKSWCMQKNQLSRCPTYHTKRDVLIRSLRRRPYRMKPTAVGFISLTTVKLETDHFAMHCVSNSHLFHSKSKSLKSQFGSNILWINILLCQSTLLFLW